jgi:ubiquinone biosynthesis protein
MDTPALPDLARLLPAEYAAFRPLVAAAGPVFLSLLPESRRHEILLTQALLPGGPAAPLRIVALLRQCPTLHKLGQLLARDRRLAPALRRQLRRLESLPPTTDVQELAPVLRAALGAKLPFRLGARALAEGSAAVVLPFRHGREQAEGVLKMPRPGIAERIESEIAAWEAVCPFLAEQGAALGLPELPYAETFAALARQLRAELDPEREQCHLAAASQLYGDGAVRVPALLPWCTPGFTAMSRLRGRPLADAEPDDARRGAALLAAGLLARPFWDAGETALFHADPHAGNLIALDEGGIGVIDWAMSARLTRQWREALLRLVLGGMTLDAPLLRRGLAGLFGRNDIPEAAVDTALAEVAHGALPGIAWALRLLDRCAILLGASLAPDLLLLRKTLANLTRVLDDLSPGFRADEVLIAEGLARLVGELPLRLAMPFAAADWPSRLAPAELWGLALALPDLGRRAWCYRQIAAIAGDPLAAAA